MLKATFVVMVLAFVAVLVAMIVHPELFGLIELAFAGLASVAVCASLAAIVDAGRI